MASSASSSTPATPGRLAREKSMAVVASDYINVVRRATELDCVAPSDLALITRYFETAEPRDELLHESHASTLRKLWRAAGLTRPRSSRRMRRSPKSPKARSTCCYRRS